MYTIRTERGIIDMHNEPLRVLHMIASLDIGGSQVMVMNLYKKIDRSRVQFDFIIDHPKELAFKEDIIKMGGKIHILPTFNGKNVVEVCKAWNDFFKTHPEYRILHTHSRSYASLYLPIAKKHGLITIAHSHSTSNGNGLTSIIKSIMQLPIRYQADYMFACSKEAGEWLFGKKASRSKKFYILPNAIDSKKFIYSPKKRELIRNELGINDEYVIGHVGRLSTPKNHTFLFAVFSEYIKKNPNSKLLLIGDGELEQALKKEVVERGIENKVLFLGAKINANDYYQAMDCFVFPSLWEGLGIAVIEAEASGLPCLVSDTVPKKVDIGAGLVQFVPLQTTPFLWKKMIPSDFERKDMSFFVKESGFDVGENAYKIQSFYERLVNIYNQ